MAMSRKRYNPIAATLNRHYRSAKENPFEPERARDYAALGHEHPGTLIVQLDDGQLVSAAIAGMTVTQGIHLDSGPTDSRPLCGASNQAETTSDINFVTCNECYELHERRMDGDGMIEGTI